MFVLIATEVEPELVTIASRCVRIEVKPLPATVVVERLLAEGVELAEAEAAAQAAGGDLERARTLATDSRLSLRYRAWRDLPSRLDGTGHRAAEVVAELSSMIDEALGPLQERQAVEAAELADEIERFGLRTGAKRSSRPGTSERSGGSAPPSCASGWPRWPAATGRRSPTRPVPRRSSTRSPASTRRRWRWPATPTRPCCSRPWWPTSPTSTSTSA